MSELKRVLELEALKIYKQIIRDIEELEQELQWARNRKDKIRIKEIERDLETLQKTKNEIIGHFDK